MKVQVYKNLHRHAYSIRAASGASKGLVIAHARSVLLFDVRFHVSEAGRQRVLRDKARNVHAWAEGFLLAMDGKTTEAGKGLWTHRTVLRDPGDGSLVRYNAYDGPDFTANGIPVVRADYLWLGDVVRALGPKWRLQDHA